MSSSTRNVPVRSISAGVSSDRIILFERTARELRRAGFTRKTAPEGVRVVGTDEIAGGGYPVDQDRIVFSGRIGSHPSMRKIRPSPSNRTARAAGRRNPPNDIERQFFGRSLKGVSLPGPGSLGRPRTRSPMMLRCT